MVSVAMRDVAAAGFGETGSMMMQLQGAISRE